MIRNISVFTRRKFRKAFKNQINKKDVALLKNKNFVLISNNCWGGEVYQWFKKPYNSPFIGLFLYGPCYSKLLSNFDHYMNQELNFIKNSNYPDRPTTYPLAKLDDIEIHFTHYESEAEAYDKWERRKSRMLKEKNKDNYFFKICDRERVTDAHIKEFHQLSYKNKLSFATKEIDSLSDENHIKVHESCKKNKKTVPNGKKLFKLTFIYFDTTNWLLG